MTLLLITGRAWSQDAPIEEIPAELFIDSGEVVADDGGPPEKPQLVYADVVTVPGAGWLRLQFELAALSGSLNAGNASFVRLTSLRDGAAQQLDAHSIQLWQHKSAYFNGNAVMIELFAYPNTGVNRLIVGGGWFGLDDGVGDAAASICGGTDDRIPSSDPAVARIIPAGCTGFLINNRQHCFLTAGHCTTVSQGGPFSPTRMQVVEFNVPLSSLSGQVVFAHPDDQYPVDTSSIQFEDTGLPGGDWCYFGAFDNSNTGLTPLQAQGASLITATSMPAIDFSPLRITGYGIDLDPPGSTGQRNQWSQTQQTDVGTFDALSIDFIPYDDIDTMGGNSGSPMIKENVAAVVGIHTHGGCDSAQFNTNHGQRIDDPALQNALANPQGICAALPPQTIHVPADYSTIQAAINIAGNGSAIIVAPGTYPEHINLLGKEIHLRSSNGPAVTIIDGQGALGTVVTCAGGEPQTTILEGFTITGGNGGGLGGGMHIANDSSPTVIDCTFIANTANWGGGVRLATSLFTESTFTNCRFYENAADRGGGMYKGGSGVVHLINCEFDGNTATEQGGGLRLSGGNAPYLTATNCSFTNNVSSSAGGGVYNTGGSGTDTVFSNCLFDSNTAGPAGGGGMYNNTTGPSTILVNCVYSHNSAGGGGAIANFSSSPDITGCEFRNNSGPASGGGAIYIWGSGTPSIGTSLFCENIPDDIVGNWNDQGGNQFLAACPVNPPPLNDDCQNPTPIGAGLTAFDNLNATTDGPPDCGLFLGDVAGNSDADVWYEFIAPCDGVASFTFEPQYDHIHAIYSPSPCVQPGVAPLVCNQVPAGASHTFTLAVVAGQSYDIRIGGDQGQTGDGLLTIACPCDHFDAYSPLIELPAQSAWEPWNGDPAAANFFVSAAQSLSPPLALAIDDNDDAVRRYYDHTSGQWIHKAWVFLPQAMTDIQYFILLNTYPAVDPRDWSLQLEMDGSASTVSDFNSTGSLPMIKGQWTEIRVEIDLNNDQQSVYYDNQLLVTKGWTDGVAPGGALNIAAVNLWGNGSNDEVYYDDLCLEDCSCPWDLNGDCIVNIQDLLIVLAQWGQPYSIQHLLQLLGQWGPCP